MMSITRKMPGRPMGWCSSRYPPPLPAAQPRWNLTPLLDDGADLVGCLLDGLLGRLAALERLLDLGADRLRHLIVIGRDETVVGMFRLLEHDLGVGQRLLALGIGQHRQTNRQPPRLQ